MTSVGILHKLMTPCPCRPVCPPATVSSMGHFYRFKRGDPVTIVSGRYRGCTGLVDSAVFQRTVDFPDEYSPGYHVALAEGTVVTVRWDQIQYNMP